MNKFLAIIRPLKYVKKDFAINLTAEVYDWLQSVFMVQVLATIVAAVQIKDVELFWRWIIIFIITEILSYIFMFIWPRFFVKAYYRFGHVLNSIYLAKYIKLDNNRIESLGTWRSFSIITKWVDSWAEVLMWRWINLTVWLFSIVYAFIIIAYTGWFYFFLSILAIFVVIFLVIYYGTNLSLKYRNLRKEQITEYDRHFIKVVMSKFEILQNDKVQHETTLLGKIIDNILVVSKKEELFWSAWSFSIKFIFAFVQLIVFFWLGFGAIRWEVSLSYFILVNGLVNMISKYLWTFSRELRKIWIYMIDVNKLLETFEDIEEIPWINNPVKFNYLNWDIKINNLTYWYTDLNIFDDFSIELKWWKKTAFVWDSGSWKTTLMKLIAGYIHPKSWSVLVDSQDISKVNLISYYKNIWYLTQDPSVFDWTVMENLCYALDHEPSKDELERAVVWSRCEFIYDLPAWMQTEIWERWVKLSGWQKQRLAIAKIMLKNPNIILLDEPTSALDSISEQLVSEAFGNLFAGRTVIVIAHRLQTVKEADEIIVIRSWKIVERWNHEELSKLKWEYSKMLELQTSF